MNIAYLDLFYRINGELHQDRKEILMYGSQKHLAKEIPMTDDLRDLEMCEIMRLPVVYHTLYNEHPVKKNGFMLLKILCCSHFQGCSFIYLFSGENWKYYLKIY